MGEANPLAPLGETPLGLCEPIPCPPWTPCIWLPFRPWDNPEGVPLAGLDERMARAAALEGFSGPKPV